MQTEALPTIGIFQPPTMPDRDWDHILHLACRARWLEHRGQDIGTAMSREYPTTPPDTVRQVMSLVHLLEAQERYVSLLIAHGIARIQ